MIVRRVALLGAGAVGAYFIWGLSEKLGEDFCVIAKGERREQLRKNGLIINGKTYVFPVTEPEQARDIDLLLISCKQDALIHCLDDIRAVVGPDTIVISLLNGVTSEEIIGNAIGAEHLLYSVMRIASVRRGNEITFCPETTAGVFLGEKDHTTPTPRMIAVEKLLEDSGIRSHFVKDIILDMWTKYASNIAQNLPQAILSVGFGAYKDSHHVRFIAERLWEEVSLVANARGVLLSPEFRLFEGPLPSARFSTLQDLDAGRHTEIEMFAGEMVQMGKECGIPVPYCEYTYHLIRALEEKNDGLFEY